MKNKLSNAVATASSKLAVIGRYKVVLFIILVAAVYGYITFTISSLSGAQPTTDQISAESSPLKTASIDKNVVRQLQQLQDNSVSVKALFEEARSNPFQE